MAKKSRASVRRAIHSRIRKKVSGTKERPRLAVYRSTKHIYAQVIDDVSSTTLASASSLDKDLKGKSGGNIEGAKLVGKAIAERAISEGIDQVVYDRGGYIYHGRVKALLDATREAGLNKDSNGSSDKADDKKEVTKEEKADKPKAKKEAEKSEEKAEKKAESKKKEEEIVESEDAKEEGDDEE